MEEICTEIAPVTVRIEGEVYPLAPRTAEMENRLLAAQKKHTGKPAHKLQRAQIRLLLGEQAEKKLFPDGKHENLDRMQRIHAGVCVAFARNAVACDRQQAQIWAEAMAPVADLLRQMERAEAYLIRRPQREEDEIWQKA